MTQPSEVRSVRVSYNGAVVMATEATWQSAADSLIAQYGAGHGIPDVRFVDLAAEAATAKLDALTALSVLHLAPASGPEHDEAVATAAPVLAEIKGGQHDVIGEARSTTDFEAAEAAGFAPAQTVYTRGTRVIELGVENAHKARAEYDAKPLVSDCCADLIRTVEAECRTDHVVQVADIRMTDAGNIEAPGIDCAAIEERAFPGLITDLRMPSASGYLSQVWPELRAMNVNAWCQEWAKDEAEELAKYEAEVEAGVVDTKTEAAPEPTTVVLRTRVSGGDRAHAVFGSVTESYTAWDVDKIAAAIREATPADARGTVTYDGYRSRFEVLFHTTVKPEEFVAGEFFRAGVVVSTDDTGGGSIRGNAVVWQNLCLNLIVIDQAEQDLFRIRHIGSLDKLVKQFRQGFAKGLAKLDHFVKAWGYACKQNLITELPPAEHEQVVGLPISKIMPGLFNGAIDRELVPVRGRRVEVVKSLVQCWEDDQSSATKHHHGVTRAALANAFTRYAHTVPQPSPWLEDEIQRAAGALVQSKAVIPYLPIKLA